MLADSRRLCVAITTARIFLCPGNTLEIGQFGEASVLGVGEGCVGVSSSNT
jgi:hypothetical protein